MVKKWWRKGKNATYQICRERPSSPFQGSIIFKDSVSEARFPGDLHPDVLLLLSPGSPYCLHPHCSPLRNPQQKLIYEAASCQPNSFFDITWNLLNGPVCDQILLMCILQLLGTKFYKPMTSNLLTVSYTSCKALVIFGLSLNVLSISQRSVLKFPKFFHVSLLVLSNFPS